MEAHATTQIGSHSFISKVKWMPKRLKSNCSARNLVIINVISTVNIVFFCQRIKENIKSDLYVHPDIKNILEVVKKGNKKPRFPSYLWVPLSTHTGEKTPASSYTKTTCPSARLPWVTPTDRAPRPKWPWGRSVAKETVSIAAHRKFALCWCNAEKSAEPWVSDGQLGESLLMSAARPMTTWTSRCVSASSREV